MLNFKKFLNLISIEEQIKFEQDIKNIIDQNNLTIPDETEIGIDDIKKSEKNDKLFQYLDLKNNRTLDGKMGKVLKKIFPHLKDHELGQMVQQYLAKETKDDYYFEEFDEVTEWYNECSNRGGINSCMVNKPKLTEFYDKIDDITILVLFDKDNKPVGRALLWHNVDYYEQNIKQSYLDRVYPNNDKITNMFVNYAKDHDLLSYNNLEYMIDLVFTITDLKDMTIVPYMDTFEFGFIEDDELILTNYESDSNTFKFGVRTGGTLLNTPIWISYAELSINSKYYIDNNEVVWEDGEWEDGTWKDGTWNDGTWEDGTWKDGTWNDGTWVDGTWENGTWKGGDWEDGTWEDGTWEDGTWKGGDWEDGWIYDPEKKGNYQDDWKWDGGHIRSSISPKEYFANTNSIQESFKSFLKKDNININLPILT